MYKFWRTDDSIAYFSNLYIRESGQMYGSRLMEHRLGVVDAFNVDYIQSHIHAANERAQKFVEHYGFAQRGTYLDESSQAPMMIYRKVVP